MVVLRDLRGICPTCGARENQQHIDDCSAWQRFLVQLDSPPLTDLDKLRRECICPLDPDDEDDPGDSISTCPIHGWQIGGESR